MPFIQPGLEPVPLAEIADVLAETVRRATGGPLFAAMSHGRDLASALELAGYLVVRAPRLTPQLTL